MPPAAARRCRARATCCLCWARWTNTYTHERREGGGERECMGSLKEGGREGVCVCVCVCVCAPSRREGGRAADDSSRCDAGCPTVRDERYGTREAIEFRIFRHAQSGILRDERYGNPAPPLGDRTTAAGAMQDTRPRHPHPEQRRNILRLGYRLGYCDSDIDSESVIRISTRISTRILRLRYRLGICDSDIDSDIDSGIDSDTATAPSSHQERGWRGWKRGRQRRSHFE